MKCKVCGATIKEIVPVTFWAVGISGELVCPSCCVWLLNVFNSSLDFSGNPSVASPAVQKAAMRVIP